MTTTQALAELYKKITGETKARNSIAKILKDLADNWPGDEPTPTPDPEPEPEPEPGPDDSEGGE